MAVRASEEATSARRTCVCEGVGTGLEGVHEEALRLRPRYLLHGYLAHKKNKHPRTLQEDYTCVGQRVGAGFEGVHEERERGFADVQQAPHMPPHLRAV